MRVTNVRVIEAASCRCDNWLAHWERSVGRTAHFCAERSCFVSFGLVGAHVQLADAPDPGWYIVPLCTQHNGNDAAVDIADGVKPVPANILGTCARS